MLRRDFKSFEHFLSMWTSTQVYNRKFIAVPWKNDYTHWHFSCTFCEFICHYDTFCYDEAKLLKLEMFVK